MTAPDPTAADHDRVARVVAAVLAHEQAIRAAPQGQVRVSWNDGSVKVVVEAHYGPEPKPPEPKKPEPPWRERWPKS